MHRNKLTDVTKIVKLRLRNGKTNPEGRTLPLQQVSVIKKKRAGGRGLLSIKRYSTAKQVNTTCCPILNTSLDKAGVNQLGLSMDFVF